MTTIEGLPSLDRYHINHSIELSREQIFEVLSNDRRRCTLHFLKSHEDEWIPLREIVDYVTAWENDRPIEEIDSSTRKCVYTALRQSHLPKLADAGIIEYDNLRGEARLTEAAREVHMYLEYVPNNDIPWHQYYLGLTAIITGLATVTWLGIYPFDGLSWTVLIAIITLLFGISAIVQTKYARENRLGTDEFYSVPELKRR